MTPNDVVRYRVRVDGRVQGVWYRESCRRQARAAGVAGWVRNNPDGSVEAVIEGDARAVDQVVDWMRHGPRHAVVTSLELTAESPKGEPTFSVW